MHGSFLTFDLSIKIEILHALLAVSMPSILLVNRGGASEASGATLTGDVDGSSRYMYDTCVKPLGQLLHAHAQMVLSQQFSKFIFTGKEKKITCSGVGSNLGLMHCRPLPLPPSQWGSGSSGLQIWLLYC